MPTPLGAPQIPDPSHILAELTDPLLIVDKGCRITYANPAAESLLGVAAGALIDVNPLTLLGDAARAPFADAFRESMTQQVPERREEYYRALDRWFEVHSHPIKVGLVVIFHDITVRKRRERRADLERRCTVALASAGNLRDGLAAALHEIRLEGDFDYGELWLVEGSARTLRVVARDHDVDPVLKAFDRSATDLSIAPHQGLPGLVWSRGEPLFVADLAADSRFLRKDEAAAAGLRSCAMLPVRSDGRTIGALGLFSHGPLGHDDTNVLLTGLTEALDPVVGLKRGATELDRLFEVSTDLACVASLDGYFLRVNPAFERVLGFTAAELTSRPFTDFVHPDDRGASNAQVMQLHEGLDVHQFEARYRTKSGDWRWLSWTAMAVIPEGLIYAFARDVTAERLQQEREALRRDFFAALATGAAFQEVLGLLITAVEAELPGSVASILLVDRDGRLQTASAPRLPVEYTAQVDGLSPGPAAGSCGAAVYHGREILATDIRSDPHWVLYREIAEQYHLRACWSFPIRASDGAILGALAAYFSVSRRPAPAELDTLDGLAHLAAIAIERHRAIEELQLLHKAVARLNDVVMITEAEPLDSPGPRIQFVNAAFERLTGWAPEEVIGRDPRFLQGEGSDRAALDRVRRALEAGEPVHEEILNYTKDGRAYWVELDIAPVLGADGRVTHFVSVERDSTDRRALQEQFLQAQKMEAVGRLAGGVAHDFNNMLTAILGFSDIILTGEPAASPWREEVEQIRLAARRAADLTRQLLAFSRRQVLQPQVLDLRDLVREMDRLLRRLIGEHVELVTTLCDDAATARVDPAQLEQAVVNLVVNAADAMPAGGRLTLEVACVAFDEAHAAAHAGVTTGPHVMLAVSDTGVGMEPEVLQRAFEPFFTTKPQGVGTGLGLSTVYGIVTQGGGHLHAESEPGRGTTIRLYFRAVDPAPVTHTPTPPSDALHHGSETILVVEDEEMVRDLIVRILERQGYRVLSAAAGDEALARSAEFEKTIDLLVTDVVMPRMTGDRLAERLVVERPGLKVLYLSGYTEDTIVHHGVLDTGVNFLEKPFTHDGLARKVREVLDGGEVRGER